MSLSWALRLALTHRVLVSRGLKHEWVVSAHGQESTMPCPRWLVPAHSELQGAARNGADGLEPSPSRSATAEPHHSGTGRCKCLSPAPQHSRGVADRHPAPRLHRYSPLARWRAVSASEEAAPTWFPVPSALRRYQAPNIHLTQYRMTRSPQST